MPRTAHEAKTAQIEQFQPYARLCCELLEDPDCSDEKRTGIAEDLEEFSKVLGRFATVELAYLTASSKQRALAEGFFAASWDIIAAVGGNRSGKIWWAVRGAVDRRAGP